ncbi:MAG: hypothetical protein ACK40M_04060 [Flavobacteriales bacterium]
MQKIKYVLFFLLTIGSLYFIIEASSGGYISFYLEENLNIKIDDNFAIILLVMLTLFPAILLFFGASYYLKIKYFAIMLDEFADAISADKWYVHFKPLSFESIMSGCLGYVAALDGKNFIISRIISGSYSEKLHGQRTNKTIYIHQAIENSSYKTGFEYIDLKTIDGLFPSEVTNFDKGIIFPKFGHLPLSEEIKECKAVIFKNLYACFKK